MQVWRGKKGWRNWVGVAQGGDLSPLGSQARRKLAWETSEKPRGLSCDTEAGKSGRWQQGARERPGAGSDGDTSGRRPRRHLSRGLLATKEQLASEEEGAGAPHRTSSQERWGKRAEAEPRSCLGFLGTLRPVLITEEKTRSVRREATCAGKSWEKSLVQVRLQAS